MIPTIAKADLDGDLSARPIIAAGVGIAISALFFAGRVVSRLMLVPNSKRWYSAFNKSDYVLLVGMLAAWTVSVLAIYSSVATGLGRHFERLREEDPTLAGPQQFMKVILADECLFFFSTSCIKFSFLCLFRSVFPSRGMHWATAIVGIIIIAWAVANFWAAIFTCVPVSAFWTFGADRQARCISVPAFSLMQWITNFVTDIVILLLPQFQVWKMMMDLKSKIALALTFLLGSFAIITSIIRLVVLLRVNADDYTWTLVDHDCWTIIELNVGVASASMPVMRPLLRKVFKVRSGIDMNMIRCDLVTVKSIQQLENQTSWSTHGGTE